MRSVPPLFLFALALVPTLFGSILLPSLPLNPFAPFLAAIYYTTPFSKAAWISCGCGMILDLFSSEFHFGIYALTLTTTSFLLFHQKKHFFEDKPLAFSIFSSVISSFSTILQLLFVHILDRGIPFSLLSLFTDAALLPALDGLYGFLWFTCPMRLYIHIKRKGWKNLFQKVQDEMQ